jgi:hypothetical protein
VFGQKVVQVWSPKRWRVTADLSNEFSLQPPTHAIFGLGGCWSTNLHAMLRCFCVRKKRGGVIWPQGLIRVAFK